MSTGQPAVFVFEGGCLEVVCEISQQGPVTISKEPKVLVEYWNKADNNTRFTYRFYSSNNSHSLMIRSISTTDQGVYYCVHQRSIPKSIKMTVFTRPDRGDPTCETSNKFPIHIVDEAVQLQCFAKIGIPEVNLSFLSSRGISLTNKTEIVTGGRKGVSIRSTLSSQSNGTTLVCFASQNYPDNILTSYGSYCSWGPIVLREHLKVTVHPFSEHLNHSSEVVFICKCNIMDSIFHWNFEPQSLKHDTYDWPGYSISKIYVPIKVTVERDLTVICKASYQGRESNATFEHRLQRSVTPNIVWYGTLASVILVSVSINVFLVFRLRNYHGQSYRSKKTSATYSTPVRPISTIFPSCFDACILRFMGFFERDLKGKSDPAEEPPPSSRQDNHPPGEEIGLTSVSSALYSISQRYSGGNIGTPWYFNDADSNVGENIHHGHGVYNERERDKGEPKISELHYEEVQECS